MSISLGLTPVEDRIARLENEIDQLLCRPPHNWHTCTYCSGMGKRDTSPFNSIVTWEACPACEGGKLIEEADEKLAILHNMGMPEK